MEIKPIHISIVFYSKPTHFNGGQKDILSTHFFDIEQKFKMMYDGWVLTLSSTLLDKYCYCACFTDSNTWNIGSIWTISEMCTFSPHIKRAAHEMDQSMIEPNEHTEMEIGNIKKKRWLFCFGMYKMLLSLLETLIQKATEPFPIDTQFCILILVFYFLYFIFYHSFWLTITFG